MVITVSTAWRVSLVGAACAYAYAATHQFCGTIDLEQTIGLLALTAATIFVVSTAVIAALSVRNPETFHARIVAGSPFGKRTALTPGQILLVAPFLAVILLFCLYATVSDWCFGHEIVPIRGRGASRVMTLKEPISVLATLTPSRTAP